MNFSAKVSAKSGRAHWRTAAIKLFKSGFFDLEEGILGRRPPARATVFLIFDEFLTVLGFEPSSRVEMSFWFGDEDDSLRRRE